MIASTAKTCFKCGVEKPLSEFYRHPRMIDGHMGKCKACAKRDVRMNRRRRISYYRKYEQERSARDSRKEQVRRYMLRRKSNCPERKQACSLVGSAIKRGVLVRRSCEVCGDPKSQAHHSDYDKPLDVRWLCFKHHRQVHGQLLYESNN